MKISYSIILLAILFGGCNSGKDEIKSIQNETNITASDNKEGLFKYIDEGKQYFKESNMSVKFDEVKTKYEKVNFETLSSKYISENNISDKYNSVKAEAIKLSEEKMELAQQTLTGGGEALQDYAKVAFRKSWEEAAAKAKADRENGTKSF